MTLPLSTEAVQAKHYQDLNTGCIYELDDDPASPTYGTYSEVFCPPEGSTILHGSGAPASGLGADGDYYIDDATDTMYGPKNSAGTPVWPVAIAPAPPPDTTAPPAPVIKGAPTSTIVSTEDGTPSTAIAVVVGYDVSHPAGGLIDLDQYTLQSTRFPLPGDATKPDWTLATQWTAQSADATGTLDTTIVQPGVLAATQYWLHVSALDKSGNRSAYSSPYVAYTTVGDSEGPARPTGIVLTPGMTVFGVRWGASPSPDYDYTEVQWRIASPAGNWSSVIVAGTTVVVTGVANGTAYDVRLRSVDRSGNTLHDTGTLGGDGLPVYATYKVADIANAEMGWVSAGQVTPVATPGSSLAWDQATINAVFAGKINADWIYTGTLLVGQGISDADAIRVVDSAGNTVGRWTSVPTNLPAGEPGGGRIEMFDPPRAADGYAGRPSYKMTLDTRGLIVWDMTNAASPIALATIGPLGIDAASITFGSARGGHNLLQNSSFELGAFGATTTTNSTWDVAADWNAANSRQGSDVNVTTGAGALTMTTV
jgi:hypothetical protein